MAKIKIVLFVEGDTEFVFFNALLGYYKQQSRKRIAEYEVVNMKGVTRYTSKLVGKLENELIPKAAEKGFEIRAVCCDYDTDVFEYSEHMPVDWKKVAREIKRLKIKEFYQIQVVHMIEDWLLDDMQGLCDYLKLKKVPNALKGDNAFQKITTLFKLGHKIYFKGKDADKIMPAINLRLIRDKHQKELADLERVLGVELSPLSISVVH